MELAALALILAAVFVWAVISARATAISAPIFFVAVGIVLAEGLSVFRLQPDPHATKLLAEVTLTWVLFADASRVRISTFRHDAGLYVRLLAVGLPLTIAGGTVVAVGLLGISSWYAVLLAAALAPTDAALGSVVMTDRRVPYRVRQTLNVESGLNDGIATPVVTTAIAAIAVEASADSAHGLGGALLGLLVGAGTGVALGAVGGALLRLAGRRGWGAEELAGPALLALSLLAYVVATLIGANGFVAAFVAGIAFGTAAGRGGETEVYFLEQTCGLASMVCWLLFGAVAVPAVAGDWGWRIVIYAMASLTVIRMLPVAIGLLGARLDRRSVLFIGWFGPRGLASVVFALIAVEELHDVRGPLADVIATIGLTVSLSVLLHGMSAQPLVRWYAARHAHGEESAEPADVTVRRLVSPVRRDG